MTFSRENSSEKEFDVVEDRVSISSSSKIYEPFQPVLIATFSDLSDVSGDIFLVEMDQNRIKNFNVFPNTLEMNLDAFPFDIMSEQIPDSPCRQAVLKNGDSLPTWVIRDKGMPVLQISPGEIFFSFPFPSPPGNYPSGELERTQLCGFLQVILDKTERFFGFLNTPQAQRDDIGWLTILQGKLQPFKGRNSTCTKCFHQDERLGCVLD